MSFTDILNSVGQSMSGNSPGGGLTSGWSQPTGAGLSAYSPQGGFPMGPASMPMHSPALLQSILSEPEQPHPMISGLHELLMHLGLMQPQQGQPQQ